MTPAQRKWLLRADANGRITSNSNNGLMKRNFEKVMWGLTKLEYVRAYHHGGYELTDLGRMVVAAERRMDTVQR